MSKRISVCVLLCLLATAACQPTSTTELTVEQRGAIADTAKQLARDVLDALVDLDADKYVGFWSDDFVMAGDMGYLTSDIDELAATNRSAFEAFESAEGTIDVMNVEVLGPNAAVLNWRIEIRVTKKDGESIAHGGLVTAVLARRVDGWKIIRQHESGFALPEG